jgi:hypothetical protein
MKTTSYRIPEELVDEILAFYRELENLIHE